MRLRSLAATSFALAAVLAPLAGCGSNALGPASSDLITVESRADHSLVLRSRADVPVYYFVVDRETLALIDWAPCTDPATCPSVPARGTTTVTRDRIVGWHESTREVAVYHWRLVPKDPHAGGGYAADSVRALIVALR